MTPTPQDRASPMRTVELSRDEALKLLGRVGRG